MTDRPAIPTSEKQAQKAVIDLFRLYGWEVVKLEEDRFAGTQGIPDLLCTSQHGLQLWIEMKRPASSRSPRGRVRKAQKERLIEWRQRGVACCVADGVTKELQNLAGFSSTVRGAVYWCDQLMTEYEWWPR